MSGIVYSCPRCGAPLEPGIHFCDECGVPTEQVILAFMAGNFCSAFLQALGQRAGNSVADLPKHMSELVRKSVKRKGKAEEIHISAEGDATATIVITARTPDEARLALLDLDVTAESVRGKALRWDTHAAVWRADSLEEPAGPPGRGWLPSRKARRWRTRGPA